MIGKPKAIRLISVFLLISGLCLIVDGAYIQAKALLSQVLIKRSFDMALHNGSTLKPWPWADTEVLAQMTINEHTQYILADASMRNLAFGPALMMNTSALSTANTFGNSVIVGHRDTHFRFLKQVQLGDLINLKHLRGADTYLVQEIVVVHEKDVEVLDNTDQRTLTLITCYPFEDISPNPSQRLVIRALKQV